MRTLPDVLLEQDNIYVLDFYELSDDLKAKIDNYLVHICQGDRRSISLENVKARFMKHINNNENHKNGFISEFLIHLVLKTEGYQQYFQLFNLESGASFKKGFDGVYYKEHQGDIWIMESKSTSTDASHNSRLDIAYDSLKDMVEGNNDNNAWENAYNHTARTAITHKQSIVDLFDILSQQYTPNNSETIELIDNCQIILCGTVFTEDTTQHTCKQTIHTNIFSAKDKPSTNCIPVAITCRVRDLIIDYIRQGSL